MIIEIMALLGLSIFIIARHIMKVETPEPPKGPWTGENGGDL